jgi:uncharacterized protein YcbK (DUF882 family)
LANRLFTHWRLVKPQHWPWKNFTAEEMASKGNGSLLVVDHFMDTLQLARDLADAGLTILSAYRDPLHNARVGGAPRSSHKLGIAADISLRGHDREELLQICREAGFTGFGFYNTFLHVDMGKPRSWGQWAS